MRQYEDMVIFGVTLGDSFPQVPPEILQDVRSFISERALRGKISANTTLVG